MAFPLDLPPPRRWQDFEDFCCDLWRRLWNDPQTQKHGRQGQPQAGVDVFGRPDDGPGWAGVQCKLRRQHTAGRLTEKEIREEVENARTFEPPLEQFILATTAPRDARSQRVARTITNTHREAGLFSVSIASWDDILQNVADHADIFNKYFGSTATRDKEEPMRLREWPAPPWPDRPYPLLLPYSHPALFAGRTREVAELEALLRQPQPILGLYAVSGAGKTSVLAAGLVPALRAKGRPVAFETRPTEPGLADRLIGDLVTGEGGLKVHDDDLHTFVAVLTKVGGLAGVAPLLVLDQFETMMRPENTEARAELGLLLAASVQRQAGGSGALCHWLLAYRQYFHGKVNCWLRDVLADARAEKLSVDKLPYNLSASDCFHAWPLPPFGTSTPRNNQKPDASWVFREAIETPLKLTSSAGTPRYPWRFVGDAAGRLARAFAEARRAQPDAPLVPELQVVLAYLLREAGEPSAGEPTEVRVPKKLEGVIDQALENHLRRALETIFLGDSASIARDARARVLLTLRELCDGEGKRGDSRPAEELASMIGNEGVEVLMSFSRRDTRLIVPVERPRRLHYELAHDRLAETIVRIVDTEGLDDDLLALHRFVRLNTELFLSGEQKQTTRIPRTRFGRIASHREALIRGSDREKWWKACLERRRSDLRRLGARSVVAAIITVIVATGIWILIQERSEQLRFLKYFATGDVDSVLVGVENREREILRVVKKILPRIHETPEDPILIGTVTWALDYFPARDQDSSVIAEARGLREEVLDPLRQIHPPPDHSSFEWVKIPSGSFTMGSQDGDSDELPRHEVTLNEFRMLAHEVTHREFRRLFPSHEGDGDFLAHARLNTSDNSPAVFVDWYQAYTYAAWLGGRLPTEAEWEYAAKAGCPSDYCIKEGSLIREVEVGEISWHAENSGERPHQIGEKLPNPWGLVDMYGNVYEWVADWYGQYLPEPQNEPVGPASGEDRVMRGGGFRSSAIYARSAYRIRYHPGVVVGDVGFRVMLPGHPAR